MSSRKTKEPELNRASLLAAASQEFASRGFQGARLELVAQEAGITRAMIYYYFGGREGLYTAALEEVYRGIRDSEMSLALDGLDPLAAMEKLTHFRIDYYVENPVMVAMIAIENQQRAMYLKESKEIQSRASPTLNALAGVLALGEASGDFRAGIDVVELHQLMVSLGMFNVSNQHTFGTLFSRDMASPERLARMREMAWEVVRGFLSPLLAGKPLKTAAASRKPRAAR